MMERSLRVIQGLREFYKVEGEWENLLSRASGGTFFLTPEWLGSWWSVFGKGKSLRILLVYADGKMVGGVPFYIRKCRVKRIFPVRELRFVGTGGSVCPDHLTGLVVPGYEGQVISAVKGYLASIQKEWDMISLADTDSEDPFCMSLASALEREEKRVIEIRKGESVPFLTLDGKGWEGYVSTLTENMQKNIRRRRRKVANEFRAEFVRGGDCKSWREEMEDFIRLHGKRRTFLKMPDKFSYADYRKFHWRLARKCAKKSRLHLSFLQLNGERVAGQYGFEKDGCLYAYQTGFDPRYGQWGVFQLLMGYLLEDGFKRGLRKIDFLRGGEAYKYDWEPDAKESVQYRIFGKTPRGRLLSTFQELKKEGIRIPKKMIGQLVHKDLFKLFVAPVRQTDLDLSRTRAEELECRWLRSDLSSDLKQIARLKGTRDVRKFLVRWKRGDRCIGAFDKGKLVHATWIGPEKWFVWEDSKRRGLPSESVFLYDALTQSGYRGRGVAIKVWNELCRWLEKEGIRHIYSVISVENRSSLRLYERLGARETGKEIKAIRLFGRSLYEKVFERKDALPITFSHEPVPLQRKDYDDFIRHYLERLKEFPQVKAVYQCGNTDYNLGISDVDLLLVLEESFRDRVQGKLSLKNLKEYPLALRRNDPILYSTKMFEENILTARWDQLTLLYGDLLPRKSLSQEERFVFEMGYLLDQIGSSLLSLFDRENSRRWRILPTLGVLRHVYHHATAYQRLFGESLEGSERYSEAISNLRRDWFQEGPEKYEKLVTLAKEGRVLTERLSFRIQEKMVQKGFFKDNPKFLRVLPTDEGFFLVFSSSPEEAKKKVDSFEGKKRFIILPSLFYAHVAFYLEGSHGLFRKLLSGQLDLPSDPEASGMIQGKYREHLQRRAEALQERFLFIWENRLLSDGLGTTVGWWGRVKGRNRYLSPLRSPATYFLYQMKKWERDQKARKFLHRIGGRQ